MFNCFALFGVAATADNGEMAVSRRVAVLAVVLLAGAALVALGLSFVAVGLYEASEIAGVIGAFVGLIGMGLSVYGIVLARRPQSAERAGVAGQVVSDSNIGGDNIQIGKARDVNIRDQ
jgi:hypothetical protein